MTHSLFNNIFFETHSELNSLKQELKQLEVTYLCNNNNDVDLSKLDHIEPQPQQKHINDDSVETVFTPEQIEKFYQIYQWNIIENVNEHENNNDELKKNLTKLDKKAQ